MVNQIFVVILTSSKERLLKNVEKNRNSTLAFSKKLKKQKHNLLLYL